MSKQNDLIKQYLIDNDYCKETLYNLSEEEFEKFQEENKDLIYKPFKSGELPYYKLEKINTPQEELNNIINIINAKNTTKKTAEIEEKINTIKSIAVFFVIVTIISIAFSVYLYSDFYIKFTDFMKNFSGIFKY